MLAVDMKNSIAKLLYIQNEFGDMLTMLLFFGTPNTVQTIPIDLCFKVGVQL